MTAIVVPRKGAEENAVEDTAEDLQQIGMSSFLCKSDGENSIKSLKQRAVQKLRETNGPVDVIFQEWRCGVAATCNRQSERSGRFRSTARTLVHACQELMCRGGIDKAP